MFPKNEGFVDRALRVAAGIVLLPAGLFALGGWDGSILGLVVALLGVIGLVTGATGRCPTYVPFGISTLPKVETTPTGRSISQPGGVG